MVAECCICIASITEPGETSASGPGGLDYPVATKCGHLRTPGDDAGGASHAYRLRVCLQQMQPTVE